MPPSKKRIRLDYTIEAECTNHYEESYRKITARKRQLANEAAFIKRFDRVQVLGSGEERTHYHYTPAPAPGHVGCVNALSWSADGSCLASGSDDFRVCLWKMGHDPAAHDPVNDVQGFSPTLGLGLQSIIHTGHTRNIFSVKWSPCCNNSRLISCAGDSRVKVFDLTRCDSPNLVRHAGKEWTEYDSSNALLHQFRCHTDRAKRISLEDSPDRFLSVSEDATVRQFDLREPHTCQIPSRSTCPPPLADYSDTGLQLYTLSVSKLRPELFVCAGTGPIAYLHDRRMGRSMEEEWGVPLKKRILSQCVRRFSLEEGPTADSTARVRAYNRRHITSVKLSEENGRDLLASYSDGPIALFDIFGESQPAADDLHQDEEETEGDVLSNAKRKRSDLSGHTVEESRPNKIDRTEEPATDNADDVQTFDYEVKIDDDGQLTVEYQLEGEEPDELGMTEDDHDSIQLLEEEIELLDASGSDSDDDLDTSEGSEEEGGAETGISYARMREIRDRSKAGLHLNVPLVLPHKNYTGHLNRDTVKDVNLGFLDQYVLSGSDDGRLFIFDKESCEIVQILEGDKAVVNVAMPHPRLPVLAVSGIDSTIKIFSPTSVTPRRFSAMGDKEGIVQANTMFAPDDFMTLLFSRFMRRQGVHPAEADGPQSIILTPADLRRLFDGQDDDEDDL